MQTQNANWQQNTSLTLIVLMIVGLLVWLPTVPTQANIDSAVGDIQFPTYDVPTAQEIADLISVPSPSYGNFDDLYEGIYPELVEELEEDVQEALWDEFGDDLEDDIEDLLEEHYGEEIENLEIITLDYDDDYDFDVLDLGLDDIEDRAGRITTTIRVEFEFEDGESETIKDKIYAEGTAEDWDNDDDEFDDVEYELSLEDIFA